MKMIWMISAIVALIDQTIKAGIRCTEPGSVLFVIPGFAEIAHVINTGAAFSILRGRTVLITLLSIGLIIGLCAYIQKNMLLTRSAQVALSCLLGGGIGNLFDRIVYHGVTDYIKLLWVDFPVFNLADIAITVSVFAMIVLLAIGKFEEAAGDNYGSSN